MKSVEQLAAEAAAALDGKDHLELSDEEFLANWDQLKQVYMRSEGDGPRHLREARETYKLLTGDTP